MNKLTIIGNVTKDPEVRTTTTGKSVCTFTVAVNRRKKTEGQPDADFFRVSAWGELGDVCSKYITKGKKVCVIGAVTVRPYTNNKGEAAASLEVMAGEVEFLSPKGQTEPTPEQPQVDPQSGFEKVETEDLPF